MVRLTTSLLIVLLAPLLLLPAGASICVCVACSCMKIQEAPHSCCDPEFDAESPSTRSPCRRLVIEEILCTETATLAQPTSIPPLAMGHIVAIEAVDAACLGSAPSGPTTRPLGHSPHTRIALRI